MKSQPWDFLDEYRGKVFHGEWPTIPEMFRITVQRHPDRRCFTAFEPKPVSLTYRQALAAVERAAGRLAADGLRAGELVGLTGKNSPEWAVAWLAVLFAGGVVAPIDYHIRTDEIRHLMRFAGVRRAFVDEEKYGELAGSGLELEQELSLSPARPGYVLEPVEAPPVPADRARRSEDLAAVLFTSGTTGNEKGVMLTHRNLVADTYLSQANLSVRPDDVFYALLPIHHSYTMTAVFLEAVSVGAEIVFGKKLVTQAILKELKAGQVTMFLGVPMLFNRLLKGIQRGIREKGPVANGLVHLMMGASGLVKKALKVNPGKRMFHGILTRVSLDRIRICISGGGPLAPSTFRRFNQMGIDFVQGYGLTETSPIVTLNPVDRYKETSVGKVIPGVEMKIVDADAKGVGEVAIRGPVVMSGYYRNEEATREVLTEDGFLLTGDMGYLDDENYLYLTGRKKSLIVTEGGKNVYPEEIENAFQLHEEVEQIMVRGYVEDEAEHVELIEALIYPSPDRFGTLPAGTAEYPQEVRRRIGQIVEEVNRGLHPWQKINRFRLIAEPLEMTTTKKIKRYKVTG